MEYISLQMLSAPFRRHGYILFLQSRFSTVSQPFCLAHQLRLLLLSLSSAAPWLDCFMTVTSREGERGWWVRGGEVKDGGKPTVSRDRVM